jgi:hypothetical protein
MNPISIIPTVNVIMPHMLRRLLQIFQIEGMRIINSIIPVPISQKRKELISEPTIENISMYCLKDCIFSSPSRTKMIFW